MSSSKNNPIANALGILRAKKLSLSLGASMRRSRSDLPYSKISI